MEYRQLFNKPTHFLKAPILKTVRTFKKKGSKRTIFTTSGNGYDIYQRMMDFEPQCSNSVYVKEWTEIVNGKEIPAVENKYIYIR